MVIYDLSCALGHDFEGWFKNSDDMLWQKDEGLLTCPYCDSSDVFKKVTAAKVTRKSNASSKKQASDALVGKNNVVTGDSSAERFSELQRMLSEVHDYVDSNFQDVGNQFTDQAISMHRGEKDKENIKGTANREQIEALKEEGVQALPLPPKPIDKKKLN